MTSIDIQIQDIQYVTGVYNTAFRLWADPEYNFTVHMVNGDVHEIGYPTRFEAVAVREAIAGKIEDLHGY